MLGLINSMFLTKWSPRDFYEHHTCNYYFSDLIIIKCKVVLFHSFHTKAPVVNLRKDMDESLWGSMDGLWTAFLEGITTELKSKSNGHKRSFKSRLPHYEIYNASQERKQDSTERYLEQKANKETGFPRRYLDILTAFPELQTAAYLPMTELFPTLD